MSDEGRIVQVRLQAGNRDRVGWLPASSSLLPGAKVLLEGEPDIVWTVIYLSRPVPRLPMDRSWAP